MRREHLLIAALIALPVWVLFQVYPQHRELVRRFGFELVVRAEIDGEPVELRAAADCAWQRTGNPGYHAYRFSVGTGLADGRGFYMQVPDFCSRGSKPEKWAEVTRQAPIDITGDLPVLYLSDSFDAPTRYLLPYRREDRAAQWRVGPRPPMLGGLPTGLYRANDVGLRLVEAHWRPLTEEELGTATMPRVDHDQDWPEHLVGKDLTGLSLIPIPSELWLMLEPPVAQDPSGRYRLYNLDDNWFLDSPLRRRAGLETLRSGRPLLRSPDGTVRLGEPGMAVIIAFASDPSPSQERNQPGRRLIVDGWTIEDTSVLDWRNLALQDSVKGITYLPMRRYLNHWLPCPEACSPGGP